MNARSYTSSLSSITTFLATAGVLAGLGVSPLRADTVYIQAGSANGGACPSSYYADSVATSTTGGFTGTASTSYKITASLTPPVYSCAAYAGVRYNSSGGTVGTLPYITLTPTLAPGGTAANFKPGSYVNTAIYLVEGARASDASGGPNVYSINYTGCSGPAASGAGTTTFFKSGAITLNAWNTITTIALNAGVTTPIVKFIISGSVPTTRTYSDSYCFVQQFSPTVTSIGSLDITSTSVTVGGCSASAAGIYLYDLSNSYALIGQNTSPGGASSVTISGLDLSLLVGHTLYASQDVPVTLNGATCHRLGDPSALTSGNSVQVQPAPDPCLGVAVVGGISKSPLAPAGYVYSDAATITCTGCSASAPAVKLEDTSNGNTVVGTGTGGASTVVVTVSGSLTTGHILCAVQTVGGVDSCVAGAPTVTVGNSSCTYVTAVGGVATANPIAAGDTSVDVTGVSTSAQDVTVYANGVQVGQNLAPGGQATVTVTTSPLVKGQYLTASQMLLGTEGCVPGSSGAPMVGGGNAAVTVCLEFSVGGTSYLWLGASGRSGGYASSPTGATVVNPGVGWQTVSWTPGTSPSWNWGTASSYTFPTSGSATLQYIWLCPNDNSEVGPYTVYIDTVQNGTTSLYNWEGDTVGLSAFMQQPSFASTGRTPIHDSPNTTLCVNTNADLGAECQRMDWEFVNSAVNNSIRGVLKSPVTCDLSKPISFRILVLPAGSNAPAVTGSQPGPKTLTVGTADSVSVSAADHSGGSSTLTYQWMKGGTAISGETSSALSFASPTMGDAGSYSCAVTNTVTGVNAGTYYAACAPFVVTVQKADPMVTAWPTASAITYGQSLADSTLSDGLATPAGTFDFTTPATVPGAGTASQSVTFTPSDTDNYNTVVGSVSVTVNQADPNVTVWPTASAINYGQTLADSSLTGGSATAAGAFAFTTPSTAPGAGTALQSVTFTPADPADYVSVSGGVSVTVNAASSTTALVSSQNPSTNGVSVTFTATVGSGVGTPAGNVVFLTNGVALATVALTGGSASTSTADLPVGTVTVEAQYAAQVNWLASSDHLDQVMASAVTLSTTNELLSIVNNGDGTFTLNFQGTPGAQYYILAGSDVSAPMTAWSPLADSTNSAPSPSGLWSFVVSNAAPAFYRSAALNPAP